jgi:hypothetical protein
MSRVCTLIAGSACCALASSAFGQGWVSFSNQTSTRLIAAPGLGASDPEEKDFAWGDFDHDGDIDLAVARKQPFTTIGRKRNVLLMNEGVADGQSVDGVLVDRTSEYATAADDGGQGFLDLTADRDMTAVDVNSDGWLDLVTAPTYGQGLAKTISHPRVYINLGEIDGEWQGFKYEEARFPNLGGAPNFCYVGAGDVTGDKAPDLYFVDYDNVSPSPFDDRLLVNNGSGFFTDESTQRCTAAMLESSFGNTSHIADMNGDGWLDIVKNENGPTKTLYNNGTGNFTAMQSTYSGASYFASVADLNADGKLDIVVSDDGTDRYLLNTGNGANGQANFNSLTFPNSGGFGSSSRYADMNQDGHLDVMICDVDVDSPGCTRVFKMYRNLGNYPNVTMADQGVGGIPANQLNGSYDVAPIDLNLDGYPDLVLARCAGISIWMNNPPSGLVFQYPQGLPAFVASDLPHQFHVNLTAVGGGTPLANSGMLFYSVNGGAFVSTPMTVVTGNLYEATFPAMSCTDVIKFYFTGQLSNGTTFKDPATAPASTYSAVSAIGTQITLQDTLEDDVSDWTVTAHASLTGGGWQQADPNSTINAGAIAAPEDDAGADIAVNAFITQNGAVGGAVSAADVDGGPAWLVSPTIDLAGTDATISYARWFYCEDAGTPDADFLFTEISNNDGASWVPVHNTGATGSAWQNVNFRVGEFVTPTAQVRLRFWTSDTPNNSVTEAGIDNLTVEELVCDAPCAPDITGNSVVDVDDLLAVINGWGGKGGPADITGNGMVDVDDLLAVINAWGACP